MVGGQWVVRQVIGGHTDSEWLEQMMSDQIDGGWCDK